MMSSGINSMLIDSEIELMSSEPSSKPAPVRLMVRMPKSLRDWLREQADIGFQSVNSEIVRRLEIARRGEVNSAAGAASQP